MRDPWPNPPQTAVAMAGQPCCRPPYEPSNSSIFQRGLAAHPLLCSGVMAKSPGSIVVPIIALIGALGCLPENPGFRAPPSAMNPDSPSEPGLPGAGPALELDSTPEATFWPSLPIRGNGPSGGTV